jgi:hypothetical protein
MATRNRAEGWKHAKLSGHSNETIITDKINLDNKFKEALANRLNIKSTLKLATVGGLNETNVLDVFGGKTKSKTDLVLEWSTKKTNISIKKSASGQVYLIGVQRFIDGYEKQFDKVIPDDVERGIRLFIAGAKDIKEIQSEKKLSAGVTAKIKAYEKSKNRLTWQTLEKYNAELTECLLDWFRSNIKELALFCFQRGLAAKKEDWADFVWYHNEVKEEVKDSLFNINEMIEELASKKSIAQIVPGTVGGGTTIKLPFGFLQWHKAQMQFHHQQKVLLQNCSPK